MQQAQAASKPGRPPVMLNTRPRCCSTKRRASAAWDVCCVTHALPMQKGRGGVAGDGGDDCSCMTERRGDRLQAGGSKRTGARPAVPLARHPAPTPAALCNALFDGLGSVRVGEADRVRRLARRARHHDAEQGAAVRQLVEREIRAAAVHHRAPHVPHVQHAVQQRAAGRPRAHLLGVGCPALHPGPACMVNRGGRMEGGAGVGEAAALAGG